MKFLIPEVYRTLLLDMGDLMPLLEDITGIEVMEGIYTKDDIEPKRAYMETKMGSKIIVDSFREFLASRSRVLLDEDTEEVLYDKDSKFNQDIFDVEVYSKVLYDVVCKVISFKLNKKLPRSVVIPKHEHYVFDIELIYDDDIFDLLSFDVPLTGEVISVMTKVILDYITNNPLLRHLMTLDNIYEVIFFKGDIAIKDYGSVYKFRYRELEFYTGGTDGENDDEERIMRSDVQPITNT